MGILVTGSIIKPRIFISTSILGPCFGSDYHFSDQTVREVCGHADIGVTPDRKLGLWRNDQGRTALIMFHRRRLERRTAWSPRWRSEAGRGD